MGGSEGSEGGGRKGRREVEDCLRIKIHSRNLNQSSILNAHNNHATIIFLLISVLISSVIIIKLYLFIELLY